MAKKVTVVISQGQSANPVKRKLEEDLVAALLFERGVEVTVIPHLYDLAPEGTGMLCLQSIAGDVVVLSWLYPRAARWTLDRNGIRGRVGKVLLESEAADEDEEDEAADDGDKPRVADSLPAPNRTIYCIDLRARNEVEPFVEEIRRIWAEASMQTVGIDLLGWIQGAPKPEQLGRYLNPGPANVDAPPANAQPAASGPVLFSPFTLQPIEPASGDKQLNGAAPKGSQPNGSAPASSEPADGAPAGPVRVEEATGRRWYPVIDYSRCTNCLECLDFCLFGVYGVGGSETILVEQPDNCRKGCPACSRVCPENAIIFPQHKTPAIAGSPEGSAGALKIDLSKLFGAPDAMEVAVLERDVELVAVGRDAVGATVGIPKRQSQKDHGPKDELDSLMDQLDSLDL
ncbi:MAG TPA: ferredoxin family protein [Pirellulales bacterium]|nr:ferredoxin family protein [Pirellulales bacterium]